MTLLRTWPTIQDSRSKWPMHNPDHYFVNDIECIKNVFTFVNYYPEENRFVIYYHGDPTLIDTNTIITKLITQLNPIVKSRLKNNIPYMDLYQLTPEIMKTIFEFPKTPVVGFNNVSYDAPMLAFIIDYINRYQFMPSTELIRDVSDMLIDVKKVFSIKPELQLAAQSVFIYPKNSQRKLSITEIDSILQGRKLHWGESTWEKLYNDWLTSNNIIDIMLLNPVKTDEAKTQFVGLKRVAAQYGLQIVEPKLKINLGDSTLEVSKDQLSDLIPYNGSDSLVTFLIYEDPMFQNEVSKRLSMIQDYAHRFRNRVNLNSTNAKLVKFYVAPDEAMPDDTHTTTFFPVWDTKHQPLIQQIKATYEYGKTTYAEMLNLDKQWTDWIQTVEGYQPTSIRSPWTNETITYPRFRVKYGELQQDLLEHMRESHTNFPIEAYHYYSLFRYSENRKLMVERFIEAYPEPPLGFTYTYKKDKYTDDKIPSIFYEYIIPGSNMRITCSIGGVHGDVMFADQYTQIANYITSRNNILKYLQTQFETGTDVLEYINNTSETMTVDGLGTFILRNFITKTGKTRNFLKPIGVPSRKSFVKIVDLENIVHADVSSLYPSIIIILRFFATWNHDTNMWEDPYNDQKEIRIKAKKVAGAVPEDQWTDVERRADVQQGQAKLFLNNASGEMDSSYNSPIRMNRNAATMRIVGQLILLDIVHTVAELGGESVSTNTDGVYMTGISLDTIKGIVNAWEEKYALEAEPEDVNRFVSKDANNRYEVLKNGANRNASGATLSNFKSLTPVKKWTQPPIIDSALINYFNTHSDVANMDISKIDKQSIREFLTTQINKMFLPETSEHDKLDLAIRLCLPIQLTADLAAFKLLGTPEQPILEPLDKVSRLIFTKHGYQLIAGKISPVKPTPAKGKPVVPTYLEDTMLNAAINNGLASNTSLCTLKTAKIKSYNSQFCTIINEDLSTILDHPLWRDLDVESYVNFTIDTLALWSNNSEKRVKERKQKILQTINELPQGVVA